MSRELEPPYFPGRVFDMPEPENPATNWYPGKHPPDPLTIDQFAAEMREMARAKAKEKGYNEGDTDHGNEVMNFLYSMGGPGHACGEIALKALRYAKLRRYEDLVKIATWAYLLAVKSIEQDGRPVKPDDKIHGSDIVIDTRPPTSNNPIQNDCCAFCKRTFYLGEQRTIYNGLQFCSQLHSQHYYEANK